MGRVTAPFLTLMKKDFRPPLFSVLDTQLPDYADEMFISTSQIDWLLHIDGHSIALFKVFELPDMAAVDVVTSTVRQPFARQAVLDGSDIKYQMLDITSQFATKKYDGLFYTVWLNSTFGAPIKQDLSRLTQAAVDWYIDYLKRVDELTFEDDE